MCTIRNPEVLRPSFLEPGEMVPVSEQHNEKWGYVTIAQYQELLRKYDKRGKHLERFRKKINRLMGVVRDLRSRLGGARAIIAHHRGE